MKARIILMIMFAIVMVWIAISGAKWAQRHNQFVEDHWQKTIDILRDK